ncbi:MAG: hypothetical protein IPL73_24210 [Candidatus Obscuribacter sp.]|nr:hypothetical protein [Candidatus Obscuribacter sp.]
MAQLPRTSCLCQILVPQLQDVRCSAPMMCELQDQYAKDGLVVIGIHHSKTVGGDKAEAVAKAVAELGYKFPVAMDNSWNTIGKFWIHGTQRAYLLLSIVLIDKMALLSEVMIWVDWKSEQPAASR